MSMISVDNNEWESSFTQILNRTKNNLNRINQRYAPTLIIDKPSNYTNNYFNNNENIVNQGNSNGLLEKTPLIHNKSYHTNNTSKPTTNMHHKTVHDMNLNDNSIYERITRLEEQQRSSDSHINHRLNQLEKSYENIYHIVDKSSIEMKDLDRNIMQLQSKLSTTNGLLDVLQNENDSKRSVISKMDSWIRQVMNRIIYAIYLLLYIISCINIL